MKIKSIRVSLQKLALTKPYTIAYNTYSDVELVFLQIELANGMVGIGSASPSEEVVGETPGQTFQHLQTEFVQNFVGRDIRHFRSLILAARAHFPHLPGTQAAIDLALHDAFGKFLGLPIAAFYGQCHFSMPTSVTIGIKNTQETLKEAAEYAQMGFKILKIKTGHDPEMDIERVLKLHEQYRNRLKIRVDANQGYDLAALQNFLTATETTDLELLEQPLPVGQEYQLLALTPAQRARLAADESLKNAEAALHLAANERPFGIFNIKLMKCGGLLAAFEIANIAQQAHIDLFWGCNDESIASISAALHAAFVCPNTRYLDLDGHLDLAEDFVSGGFLLENGEMRLGLGTGLGIREKELHLPLKNE